jgi:hypothetical protein
MLPAKLGSIWPSNFREDLLTVSNQKQELTLAAIVLVERDEMKKLHRGPCIDAFCQVWFHLAQLFQKRRLKCEKVNGRMTNVK